MTHADFRLRPFHMQQRIARTTLLASIMLLPPLAFAEGARKELDCQIVRVCDAAGVCQAGDGNVSFTMEPVEVGESGAGRYQLSYAQTTSEMQAVADAGPFIWTAGQERHVLVASSETEWLWHRLDLAAAPTATIRFLGCSFRQ